MASRRLPTGHGVHFMGFLQAEATPSRWGCQENSGGGGGGGDPGGQSSWGSGNTPAGAARGGVSGRGVGEEIGQRGRGAGRQRRGRAGGRPRWPRILRRTSAASIVAMTEMRQPQRGHARTSRSKTRRV